MIKKGSEENYLKLQPHDIDWGACKLLLTRSETIHLKHIFTKIFVKQNNWAKYNEIFGHLDMTAYDYMQIMTNHLRRIYKIPRGFQASISLLRPGRNDFFPTLQNLDGLKTLVVLDFDGVITDKRFTEMYDLCYSRARKLFIVSANPEVSKEFMYKKGLFSNRVDKIFACKGKWQKLKKIIELKKIYDFVFYIDDEDMYLDVAWMFGIKTYKWNGKAVKPYSPK